MASTRKKAGSGYTLKIQPDLDTLYMGLWQDLAVYMVNEKNEQAQEVTVPFEIQLKYFKEDVCVPEHERVIQFEQGIKPRQEFLLKNGVCHLKFQMLQLSRDLGNREFALQFACSQPVILVRTPHPIRVVKYKIDIRSNLPPLFFKDQGGQHNCMELLALLVDETGQPPPRQRLESLARAGQFVAELLYESGEFVKEQTVLSVKTLHVGLDGLITCRFRISDVSKRHLSQRFRIRIVASVQTSPENNDIASVVSGPVEVRSKQKKNEEKIYSNVKTRKRTEFELGAPLEQLREILDGQTPGVPKKAKGGRGQWMDGDKVLKLTQTLEWCRASHALLEGLEWQLIGYELTRDGSNNVDANLPLYRCPTCWEYKDRFRPPSAPPPRHHPQCPLAQHLVMYRDTIVHCLDNLAEPGPEDCPEDLTNHNTALVLHSAASAHAVVKHECDSSDEDEDESTPLPMSAPPFTPFRKGNPLDTPAIPPPPVPLPGELPDWSRSGLRQESLRQPSFGDWSFPSLSSNGLGREGSLPHFGGLAPISVNFSGGNDLEAFYAVNEPKKEESEEEDKVAHILVSPGAALGHPAFDSSHNLIGFYQDVTGRSNEVNSLSFTSFKRLPEDVRNSQQVQELRKKAEIAFASSTPSLKHRSASASLLNSSSSSSCWDWTGNTPCSSSSSSSSSSSLSSTSAPLDPSSSSARPLLVSRKTSISAMKEQVVLAAYSIRNGDGAFAHMFAH